MFLRTFTLDISDSSILKHIFKVLFQILDNLLDIFYNKIKIYHNEELLIMKLTGLFPWQSICHKTKFWIILIIGIFGFVSVALPGVVRVGDVNGGGEVTEDDAWLVL